MSSGDEGAVIMWDTITWQPIMTSRDHATVVWTARFSVDGNLIITGDEGGLIEIRDAHTGQRGRTLPPNPGRAWSLDVHPNGKWVVASGGDEVVRVWDIHTGELVRVLTGHTGALRFVAFSPDGRLIASAADDQTVRLWDAHTGECLQVLRVERPYEGLRIAGTRGLSGAQRASLMALGAVE
jgi:WD40 repeat protein